MYQQSLQELDWGFDAGDMLGLNDEDEAEVLPASKAEKDDDDYNWKAHLAYNEDGEIKSNIHNLEILVQNDPRLVDRMAYNEVTQANVMLREPGRSNKSSVTANASANSTVQYGRSGLTASA